MPVVFAAFPGPMSDSSVPPLVSFTGVAQIDRDPGGALWSLPGSDNDVLVVYRLDIPGLSPAVILLIFHYCELKDVGRIKKQCVIYFRCLGAVEKN